MNVIRSLTVLYVPWALIVTAIGKLAYTSGTPNGRQRGRKASADCPSSRRLTGAHRAIHHLSDIFRENKEAGRTHSKTYALQTSRFFSLAIGFVHAVGLLVVAVSLGYSIGPSEYSPVSLLWRYGGLVVVAAVPVWLAVRFRLITPLIALTLTTAYVLGVELTPPGPTFRDVAELEGLAEPTGITVVENGLYIVRYMVNASVWTVGFLFLGLVEYAVRNTWTYPPSVPGSVPWLSIPAPQRRATAIAAAGGLLHAAVMVWYAARLGVTLSGGLEWLLYLFGAVGMWVIAAVPLYLLVRHRLIAPATLLTLFILIDVQAAFTANVEDPHTLYFGGWFFYLGIILIVAGIEYGLRRLDVYQRFASEV
ncbi:hypothetical protein [Halosolutus halophilus]|uniref:hypothetical protein n=1 Tax=Halosolutus halophilus TaxID=1552990 RepID=UPI0022350ABB|nr:hypothetical protein [Halosolutus halophilus]